MFTRLLLSGVLVPFAGGAFAQTHLPEGDYIVPPEPGIVQGCGYYTILGATRTLDGAFALQDRLEATGSGVLDGDRVAQFTDGYHVIVFGPFGTQALAEDRAGDWRGQVPDVYVKYGCVDGVEDRPGAPEPVDAPLPISRGVYVLTDLACAQPPNFAFRVWDGTGLSGSSTRDCRFDVVAREGDLYGGTNTCADTYDGSRGAVALSVRVTGAARFRLVEDGGAARDYRYCAGLDPADFTAR